jgi:hypothetical protein
MSATGVVSMAFAGIAGDVVGVRNVFLGAGLIAGSGALVAIAGYRRRPAAPPDPLPLEAVVAD